MNADELKETVLNPANRTLRRITIDDAKLAEESLEICMGQEVAPRRKFIEENAYSITDINI